MNAPCKIMIVEDDTIFCKSLVAILNQNGYQALDPVHNYEDAKAQLLQSEPDLALIDIGLPGEKDGIQLATYLFEFTQIPVVFITGCDDAVTAHRIKKSHPKGIVIKTKPLFNGQELIDAVKKQLLISVMLAAPDDLTGLKIKPKGLLLKVTVRNPEPVKTKRSVFAMSIAPDQKKTLVPFDNIQFIATNNEQKRNTILIKMSGGLEYICRETIANIEKKLPAYFVKIKNALIINIKQVSQCVEERALLVGTDWFEVSEPLRPTVREKKHIYLSHL